MATLLEIYNLALGNLGIQQAVASTTELTNEAIACNRFYDQALDTVLSEHPWPFATKWVSLAVITEVPLTVPPVPVKPLADWEYVYTYPSDCVTLRNLVPMSGLGSRPLAGWGHLIRVPYALAHYTVPLTVSINQASTQSDPTTTVPVTFTVVFSEAIVSALFVVSDITLSGTAPGKSVVSITEIAPLNGTTFSVTVTSTGVGTITATIPVGVVATVTGLTNEVSYSVDNTVTRV